MDCTDGVQIQAAHRVGALSVHVGAGERPDVARVLARMVGFGLCRAGRLVVVRMSDSERYRLQLSRFQRGSERKGRPQPVS